MNFEGKVSQKSNTCQLFNFCLKIRFLAFSNSLSYLRSNIFRVIFLGLPRWCYRTPQKRQKIEVEKLVEDLFRGKLCVFLRFLVT